MKRLIYVLNSYSESDSSHFTHILHLLDVMAQQGCEIVLVIEKAGVLPAFDSASVRAVGLRSKIPVLRHAELFLRVVSLIRRGYSRSFVRIAAPASIVVSLAHRIFGGRAFLWQSGTTHEHDWAQSTSFAKLRWWFSAYVPNYLARRLVHTFVTGPELMVDYYAEVVGVPRRKIRLLYNDVQIERFTLSRSEENRYRFLHAHTMPPHSLVFLMVHRLSPVRRALNYLEPMLRALKLSSPTEHWVLVVAGGGSELGAAKTLIVSLELEGHCVFLGDVPNHEVPALYAMADLFLHPTFTEGFPRVLIEAMAAGLPIVSTDAGGTRQLLGIAQQSYVSNRRYPAAFAEAVLALLTQREQWPILSRENRQEVQRFATPQVAAMYIRTIFQ